LLRPHAIGWVLQRGQVSKQGSLDGLLWGNGGRLRLNQQQGGDEDTQQGALPMPIRKHLTDKTAFGPAAIEAMSNAFEEACIALQVYAGDEKGREIIATRIIDLARSGLVDPTALRDRVIAEARLSE
jgi:hypothetical protein